MYDVAIVQEPATWFLWQHSQQWLIHIYQMMFWNFMKMPVWTQLLERWLLCWLVSSVTLNCMCNRKLLIASQIRKATKTQLVWWQELVVTESLEASHGLLGNVANRLEVASLKHRCIALTLCAAFGIFNCSFHLAGIGHPVALKWVNAVMLWWSEFVFVLSSRSIWKQIQLLAFILINR